MLNARFRRCANWQLETTLPPWWLSFTLLPTNTHQIVNMDNWIPTVTMGRHFEEKAFLGPFMRPTTIPDVDVCDVLFVEV